MSIGTSEDLIAENRRLHDELNQSYAKITKLKEALQQLVHATYCLAWGDRKIQTQEACDRARKILGQ